MQPKSIVSLFVVTAVGLAPQTSLQSAPPKKVASIEGITEYHFDNGVKALLFPDTSQPTVTVNMTVFVGSRHEGYGEAGMAHLLEHMLFKGTPDHPNVPKVLQARGARFNGTTWLDRTNYYETLPASNENLEFAIRLEADRMMNSFIKGEDLASEMTVVRNEFERGENVPSRVLFQRMMSAAFEWHNYGRSTIGNRADIERVPVENLRRFYRKYYQPDNVAVVVAGKFEQDKALEYLQKYFGSIPSPQRKLDATYTEEPAQDGERQVMLRRVGEVAVVGSLYHIPSGAHPDFVAIDVLESILTAAPAGRLYKALVETRKASSVSGGAYALHDPGVLRFVAEVSQGVAAENVLETLVDVVENVANEPVTESEVKRAKDRLLRFREQSTSDTSQLAIELSEWAAQGDWRLFFLYRDRLEKVTPADVKRVAAAYLRQNNRTVGMYLPTEKAERISVPNTPELAKMIGDYKGRKLVSAGEAFEVTPTNIESRTKRSTLPSGLKMALLPKKTRGETVKVQLNLRYGDLAALLGRAKACDVLPAMLLRGTKNLSRQDLQDELNKHRIQLSASGGPGVITFSIQTTRPKLPIALDLLRQVVREPVFPQQEFEIIKRSQLSSLEQRITNPQSVATNTVNRVINPYPADAPRYIPTPKEEIATVKATKVDDVKAVYDELVSGQSGELVVVGDFDSGEVTTVVKNMLDGWESSHTYARVARNGNVKYKGGFREVIIPDKANAVYFAGSVLPMRDDNPDYPALVMGNYILGGGSLSSRLGDRVRQQEGLSYGVGSGLRASSLDKRTTFYIYAITNPVNVPKLRAVIQEELGKLLKQGVTDQELAAAKKGYLQRREVARTNDAQLAGILDATIVAKRTMAFTSQLEQKIGSVTKQQVHAALKKHLHPDKLVIVAVGDMKQAKSPKKPAAGAKKKTAKPAANK